MPVLKGGKKRAIRKKPYGTVVEEVKRGKPIGEGMEGNVFETKVTVKKGNRTRTITLAEKKFKYGIAGSAEVNVGRPGRQFVTMSRLTRLNKEKKLGLRIVPTIRLLKTEGRKPTLIITKFETQDTTTLNQKHYNEFRIDMERQRRTAEENGYHIHGDAFHPHIDKKTGECLAIISDFGNIWRIRKRKKKASNTSDFL